MTEQVTTNSSASSKAAEEAPGAEVASVNESQKVEAAASAKEGASENRDSENGDSPRSKSAGGTKEASTTKRRKAPKPKADDFPSRENVKIEPREKIEVNLRSLLQAGVHFGHQTSRWCPKMAPYIFGARNGIHIINLPLTMDRWQVARKAIVENAANGGNILFVGTKKQAQEAIRTEALRCNGYYVSRRWLGGMMTNFQTIKKSIDRLGKIEETLAEEEKSLAEGKGSKFTKKERLMMSRELEKLNFSLGGIRGMHGAPQMMFIVDIKREDIAVKEARRLDIPIFGLVDTNCDPGLINYPIPSNDDGTRAIRFFAGAVADAVLEGRQIFKERRAAHGNKAANVQVTDAGSKAAPKSAKKAAPAKKAAASAEKPASEAPAADKAASPEAPAAK